MPELHAQRCKGARRHHSCQAMWCNSAVFLAAHSRSAHQRKFLLAIDHTFANSECAELFNSCTRILENCQDVIVAGILWEVYVNVLHSLQCHKFQVPRTSLSQQQLAICSAVTMQQICTQTSTWQAYTAQANKSYSNCGNLCTLIR